MTLSTWPYAQLSFSIQAGGVSDCHGLGGLSAIWMISPNSGGWKFEIRSQCGPALVRVLFQMADFVSMSVPGGR